LAAYRILQQGPNYIYLPVNFHYFVFLENQEVHTQIIENCWIQAKKELHNIHGVYNSSLEDCLYEFALLKKFLSKKKL
jgi:hypothetical protein